MRTGIALNEGVEIFGELSSGDTILIRGSEEIKPGTLVSVKIEEQ